MIECYAAKLGVKHVSRDEYPSIIRRVSREWIKQHAVSMIILAGMVGGNLGWRDVPMVQSPAGEDEIAAGMVGVDLTDMPRSRSSRACSASPLMACPE
jgi:2-keto-3-deoxy-galactonokinase